jgi:hypothetical protein
MIAAHVPSSHQEKILKFVDKTFLPGGLVDLIIRHDIKLKGSLRSFLGAILENCRKQELAEHGEGFWTDHWTYNLDLIESYVALYPENLDLILLKDRHFTFYHNVHYVLPRSKRYVVTPQGVRQYKCVFHPEKSVKHDDSKLKTSHGKGEVYHTNLAVKLLCLIANKSATFDPSGVGIEMEADKPNWYDALNGLPGLLGSSISETFELKRFAQFFLSSLEGRSSQNIKVFAELAHFVRILKEHLLIQDPLSYWNKSNEVKEEYRQSVRQGIDGREEDMGVEEIKEFLHLVILKTNSAIKLAENKQGFLSTYFYHEVVQYDKIDDKHVSPLAFKRHDLPLFLEGYVHALRAEDGEDRLKVLYAQVRKSPLFDRKLKMFRVNASLARESEEIGRTRIFPSGWLENESIWLHMEYKFILELLRRGLFDEFYENFYNVLIPFLKPEQYGRSILENSSFLASSAHEDPSIHGQGFVARLSGSTAEFTHMWLLMNAGLDPFSLDLNGQLTLHFKPVLKGDLFTKKAVTIRFHDKDIVLPKNTYAFNFLGSTLVVYHNSSRLNTFGHRAATIKKIDLRYADGKKFAIMSPYIGHPHANDVRNRKVEQIDVYF